MAETSGNGLLALQIVLLVVAVAFGIFTASQGSWFYAIFSLVAVAGVLTAMRRGAVR